MLDPIKLAPIYQERVWGGRGLATKLGRDLPEGKVIGESWEVVDRPEAQSIAVDGEFAGKALREIILERGAEVMGPDYDVNRPFPILVKWLDCQDRLSLQVHPPASVADELQGEPKTENWYIADCEEGASLIVGLKEGATRASFEEALKANTLESCVHRFPVKPGDSILVESGRIHAIDAGNLILEIQQNSDTTYRVYDWGRVGLDGAPRQLHVEQSMRSIDFNDFEPDAMQTAGESAILAECSEFRIRKYELKAGETFNIDTTAGSALLHVVAGVVTTGSFTGQGGQNVLIPYGGVSTYAASEDSVVLVTDAY